jgi:hypothetical protein
MKELAVQLGVSDKAISKWVKSYGLHKPGRGYWNRHPAQDSNLEK